MPVAKLGESIDGSFATGANIYIPKRIGQDSNLLRAAVPNIAVRSGDVPGSIYSVTLSRHRCQPTITPRDP